jgi:hypothetical protein
MARTRTVAVVGGLFRTGNLIKLQFHLRVFGPSDLPGTAHDEIKV